MRRMDRRATTLFLALGLAWGIPYLLIKVSVEEISPSMLVFSRTALAAAILLPIALAKGGVLPALRHWRALGVYTVVEIAIPWLLLGRAEQDLPSSTTGLLIAAVPLAGVGLAFATGRSERLGTLGWLGLLAGLAGVAALVGLDIDTSHRGAVLEVLVVVVGYAIGPVIIARHLGDQQGIAVAAITLAATAVIYLPVVVLGDAIPSEVPSAKVFASIVVLATVCTAGAFVMLFALVGLIGPVRATAITYLNPAVAIVAGAVFLSEEITVWTAVGFALVLLGSFLITRRPGGSEAPPPPEMGAALEPPAGSVVVAGAAERLLELGRDEAEPLARRR